MPLKVVKKERETSQSLIRRFSRDVKKSNLLLKVREDRFRRRNKSRQMKKRSALRREELRREYERLEKMGKLLRRNKF